MTRIFIYGLFIVLCNLAGTAYWGHYLERVIGPGRSTISLDSLECAKWSWCNDFVICQKESQPIWIFTTKKTFSLLLQILLMKFGRQYGETNRKNSFLKISYDEWFILNTQTCKNWWWSHYSGTEGISWQQCDVFRPNFVSKGPYIKGLKEVIFKSPLGGAVSNILVKLLITFEMSRIQS